MLSSFSLLSLLLPCFLVSLCPCVLCPVFRVPYASTRYPPRATPRPSHGHPARRRLPFLQCRRGRALQEGQYNGGGGPDISCQVRHCVLPSFSIFACPSRCPSLLRFISPYSPPLYLRLISLHLPLISLHLPLIPVFLSLISLYLLLFCFYQGNVSEERNIHLEE